jgi:nitrate/nitrite transporter NarK
MVANSLHSDRSRERRVHVSIPLFGGGLLLLAAVMTAGFSTWMAYIFLSLSGMGLFGPLGPFWSIPSETLPKNVVGSAIGLINAIGSLGGYFGPLAVGYLERQTGSYHLAFGMLALVMLLGSALSFLLERNHRPPSSDAHGPAVAPNLSNR